MASPGDVDGDGVPDILVTAPNAKLGTLFTPGLVLVFPGRDGSPLFRLEEMESYDSLGSSVSSLGELDADGLPEFLVSARGAVTDGAHGPGSIFLSGFDLILKTSSESLSISAGGSLDLFLRFPPQAVAFTGLLDGTAQAFPRLVFPPGSLPAKLIGRRIHFAAITRQLDVSSVAQALDFLP
ncbi:MAG: integrin alpha [Planctomycetota bacterium]